MCNAHIDKPKGEREENMTLLDEQKKRDTQAYNANDLLIIRLANIVETYAFKKYGLIREVEPCFIEVLKEDSEHLVFSYFDNNEKYMINLQTKRIYSVMSRKFEKELIAHIKACQE